MGRDHVRLLVAVVAGVVICAVALALGGTGGGPDATERARDADYSVMAGHEIAYPCFGNFYARHGDAVVLTTVAHCHGTEGTDAFDGSGRLRGTWGPVATGPPCDPAWQSCLASDMTYIALAPDRVPWGRLDQVLMGRIGYRGIAGGRALSCEEIPVGARVELTGIGRYRDGRVVSRMPYGGPGAATVFPCIIETDLPGFIGDSGGPVFVDGRPAGITSQRLGEVIGFTPLAEGLDALGLTLCTAPDCGLVPPSSAPRQSASAP